MAKPQPIEIPSDDCAVEIAGRTYFPHEGESIWMIPGARSVEDVHFTRIFYEITPKLQALAGEDNEAEQTTALLDDTYTGVLGMLARRLVRWDWTDDLGNPLPQPDGTPGPLRVLRESEIGWLMGVARGETPVERKNGSRPSPTTSSATASRRRRK